MHLLLIKNFKKYICYNGDNLKTIITRINSKNLKLKFQIVIDQNFKIKGTITDGDIRRGILKNISIDSNIDKIMNKKFVVGYVDDDKNNKSKLDNLSKLENSK